MDKNTGVGGGGGGGWLLDPRLVHICVFVTAKELLNAVPPTSTDSSVFIPIWRGCTGTMLNYTEECKRSRV